VIVLPPVEEVQDSSVFGSGLETQCQSPTVLDWLLSALSRTEWASPQSAGLPSFAEEVTACGVPLPKIGSHWMVRTAGWPLVPEFAEAAGAGAAEVFVGDEALFGVVGVFVVGVVTVGVVTAGVVGATVVSATDVFLWSLPPLASRITITTTAAIRAPTAAMRPQRGPLRPGRRLGLVAVAFAALALAAARVALLAGAFAAGSLAGAFALELPAARAAGFFAADFFAAVFAAAFFAGDLRALLLRAALLRAPLFGAAMAGHY
jgi:hypothetical protein